MAHIGSRRNYQNPGLRKQCQRDFRQVPGACGNPARIWSFSTSLMNSAITCGIMRSPVRPCWKSRAHHGSRRKFRVDVGYRVGRHDRLRRLSENSFRRAKLSPAKRCSARHCCTTGLALTASRASATNMCPGFTTPRIRIWWSPLTTRPRSV